MAHLRLISDSSNTRLCPCWHSKLVVHKLDSLLRPITQTNVEQIGLTIIWLSNFLTFLFFMSLAELPFAHTRENVTHVSSLREGGLGAVCKSFAGGHYS